MANDEKMQRLQTLVEAKGELICALKEKEALLENVIEKQRREISMLVLKYNQEHRMRTQKRSFWERLFGYVGE